MITPIFVGGVPRSGTTILGHMLTDHPDIFFKPPHEIKFITEGFGLLDLCFGVRKFPKSQVNILGRLIMAISKYDPKLIRFLKFKKRIFGEWWETSEYNPGGALDITISKQTMNDLLKELRKNLDNVTLASKDFVLNYIENNNQYSGQKYWIDTCPDNIAYADLIYKIFPEAKFIEIRRNPLDVLGSVISQPWGPSNEDEAIEWWIDKRKMSNLSVLKIPKENYFLLNLEDLSNNDKENTYRELCKFIGISDNDPKVLYMLNNIVNSTNAHTDRWLLDFENPENFKNKFNQRTKLIV